MQSPDLASYASCTTTDEAAQPRAYRLHATLSVAGEDCTYSASLSDAYTGMLLCPGKGPVPLILWVK